MGPPPQLRRGFQRGPSLSTKPSKASGAGYDLSGFCKLWEILGHQERPKATAEATPENYHLNYLRPRNDE